MDITNGSIVGGFFTKLHIAEEWIDNQDNQEKYNIFEDEE